MTRRRARRDERPLLVLLRWALPPALLVLAADLGFAAAFDVKPFAFGALALDFAIALYLMLCFVEAQRRLPAACLLGCVVLGGAVAIAWTKVAILGTGPRYKDLGLAWDALRVASPVWRVAAVALLAAIAAGALWNFRRPKAASLPLFLPVLGYAAVLSMKILVPPVGATIPTALPTSLYQGFQHLGHLMMMLSDPLTHFDRREQLRRAEVAAPPDMPTLLAEAALPPLDRRNLHVVVVESLFDVTQLEGYAFSEDPMSPLFRRWRSLPRTTAISPVFGGRSSNPEFEVLCGLPVAIDDGQVLFWDLARPSIDCLPRLLAGRGWTASAFVPAAPEFFNAVNAYRMIGFTRHVSIDDMDSSDRDDQWMSAESIARQNLAHLRALRAEGRPYLNYVFLVSGHFPYWIDQARRPLSIRVTPDDHTLVRYANALHYNTQAVEAMVAAIRAEDPDALIAIVGDHAPPLGANYAEYRKGGLLPGTGRLETTAPRLYETPLVVLDGDEMLPLGRVPQYLLPEILLDRLSRGAYCRQNRCAYTAPRVLRPFADAALIFDREGGDWRACAGLAEARVEPCRTAAARSLYLQKKVFELVE